MAWLSRVNFTAADVLSYTDMNNIGNDIRSWGGNVNGGGYSLSNVVFGSISSISGGTGASSSLTMQSTSGTGTSDYIALRTASQLERMRITSAGNVGIGTVSPDVALDIQRTSADVEMRAYTGSVDLRFWAYHVGAGVVGTNSAHPLIFGTNGLLERMRIDTSGNVGIGTASPVTRLQVGSVFGLGGVLGDVTLSASALQTYNIASDGASITWNAAVNGGFSNTAMARLKARINTSAENCLDVYCGSWNNNNSPNLVATFKSNGNVGIGTLTPSYQLQLSTDSAAKPSTNTWTIASDARIKTVKGEYQKGLSEICQIRPVRYEYNGLGGFAADGKEQVSILAQELMQVFPECVDTFKGKLSEDSAEIDLYNYNGHAITFALINAIKELKAEIEKLKARN